MRVLDTFTIKSRGVAICVELDGAQPVNGAVLRRRSDGQTWTVTGVERNARGPTGALLVRENPAPAVGDDLEWLTLSSRRLTVG